MRAHRFTTHTVTLARPRLSPLFFISPLSAGVHPLHIAVKREYTDCIEYLMSYELPLQKVKDELAWAVQYDLSKSVMCLLTAGAPHGLRVLAPWTLEAAARAAG